MPEIFDAWPDRYDEWFETPIGKLIRQYESELILEMLKPRKSERILDAGCGTGIFTYDVLCAGARVVGLDLSVPMLTRAGEKLQGYPFEALQGDMRRLPFGDHVFDKVFSVTAIEFIEHAKNAIEDLFRVTKPRGCIVVATLNRASPWASRREEAGKKGHSLFSRTVFRSPDDMAKLAPVPGVIKTAIHFQKDEDVERAREWEMIGQSEGLNTGAFLVARWEKPV